MLTVTWYASLQALTLHTLHSLQCSSVVLLVWEATSIEMNGIFAADVIHRLHSALTKGL